MKCKSFLFIVVFICSNHLFARIMQQSSQNIAIVLGTTVTDSSPAPSFEQRILHGIYLYQNGTVQKLLFTGGIVHGRKYAEADVAYRYCIKKSIPAQDIIIEDKATNTIENLRLVKKHLDTVHYQKIYLVTDSIHIQRALLIAKKENISVIPSASNTNYISSKIDKFKYRFRESIYRVLYSISNLFN